MAQDSARPIKHTRPDWSNTAFVVEALVLLVALLAASAILVQMFAYAHKTSDQTADLANAVVLAQNAAEEFSANPAAAAAGATTGIGAATGTASSSLLEGAEGLSVACNVTSENTSAGTLYTAHITVTDDPGAEIYTLTATRYVSGAM